MPQRTNTEPASGSDKQRAPLSQRLWRNQLGIALAIALTIAAGYMLMMGARG